MAEGVRRRLDAPPRSGGDAALTTGSRWPSFSLLPSHEPGCLVVARRRTQKPLSQHSFIDPTCHSAHSTH